MRDDHIGKVVRTHAVDGNHVVSTTLSIDGVMPEEFKKYTDNYMENVPKTFTEQKLELTKLDDDEGHKCVLQKFTPAMPMVSARSMVVTYYPCHSGDDVVFIVSSQGNEKLQEAQKDKIGSDVVSKLIINYMKWSPKYDSCGDVIGTECLNISEASPEGDIPDMMRKKLAERQSMAMEAVAAFVRKQ